MRTVIIRDDDTNALTPVECLERLYRPFLDRRLPVNLAVIPEVRTDVRLPDGGFEGFLMARTGSEPETLPMAKNTRLVEYLKGSGYDIVQHGCYHDVFEFDRTDRAEVTRRLEHGARRLEEAGLGRPRAFVAPHDKFSRTSLVAVAERFPVISSGWFELGRVPHAWWPKYAMRKVSKRPHWRAGSAALMSHPGCLLSYRRPVGTILDSIKRVLDAQEVTVLVTHWWEYFSEGRGRANDAFVRVLHDTAEFLANEPDIRVASFEDVAAGRVALN